MAGYNFDLQSAQRIVNSLKKVEGQATDLTGTPNPGMAVGTTFWAMLTTAADPSGKIWSWIAVVPDPTGLSACGVSNTLASTAWKYKTPWVVGNGNAREANDHVGIDQGTIVQMTYVGTTVPENVGNAMPQGTSVNGASLDDVTPASGAVPWYIFTYNLPPQQSGIPIHDHRDNFSGGGFAFAVFHPGTSVPQQPWAI